MKKTVVCQVIAELGDGGVETMLLDVYRNINREQFKFIFIVQNDKRKYEKEIRNFGGEILQVSSLKQVGIIKYIQQLKKVFKTEKVDVVHCHNLTQNPIILFTAFISNIKIRVSHSHLTTCFSEKAKLVMPIIRFLINIFSTSKISCGKQAGEFLYGKSDFIIVHNAIDTDKFINAKYNNNLSLIPNIYNKKVVLHVGRLSEQKNHEYIFKIAKQLINEDVIFVCCGDGPRFTKLNEIIKKDGLDDKVYLLGSRNDIHEIMKGADLLILPSLYEGLPVTIIEAQASNLKCIVSNQVDKDCDLGLDLVTFLPINNNDTKIWADLILDNTSHKNCNKKIRDRLKSCGYDGMANGKILSEIYRGIKK